MIYFNKDMREADQFCKKLGITGHKIFIASNGAMALNFKTKAQSEKYAKAKLAQMSSLGYTCTTLDHDAPMMDWEKTIVNEMEAVRH
jgi:hypothetical protein